MNLLPTPLLPPPPSASNASAIATYQIDDVKDQNGVAITSAKIYIDGNYIHHYAPEKLTFCDNCQCYDGVACPLGIHKITLSKDGYSDWSENKTINPSDKLEVNPIMTAIITDSPDSSSEQSSQDQVTIVESKADLVISQVSPATSSKTATISLSSDQKKKIVSASGVLAEVLSASVASQLESTPENKTNLSTFAKKENTSINPFFLIAGVFIIASAGFMVWRQKGKI